MKTPRSDEFFLRAVKTNPRRKQNTNWCLISTVLPLQRHQEHLQEVEGDLPLKSASVVRETEINHSQPRWRDSP